MSLSPQTQLFVSQLGQLLTWVDSTSEPAGPANTLAYKLVPTSGWHNSQRFPHKVEVELQNAGLDTVKIEGVEYYMVPETSSNVPGILSHYAQRTGVPELKNPRGGVNRALDLGRPDHKNTVAPDAVSKYIASTDNFEEARKKETAENDRVRRQIGH